MRFRTWIVSLRMCLILAILIPSLPLLADPVEEVTAALDELDEWLTTSSTNGPAWQKYLKNDALRTELTKGDDADRETIQAALSRYQSDVDGIGMKRFVAVRRALAAWQSVLAAPQRDEIPALLIAAKDQFAAKTDQDVATARAKLQSAAATLTAFLDTDGVNGPGWKKFLKTDDIEAELASDKPDLKKLESAARRFASGEASLEMAQFMNVGQALRSYIDTYSAATNPKVKEQFKKQTEVLAKLLEEHAKKPTFRSAQAIGDRIDFFERMGQVPNLVAAIREHHSHPNLLAYVSEQVLAAGIDDEEIRQETRGLADNILDTSIFTDAVTVGNLRTSLAPDASRAVFVTTLKAKTTSTSVGYNGPVTIWTSGQAKIHATKRFEMSKEGLRADPAVASAALSSQINDISARFRFIERVAWKKAGEQQALANAIATQRVEARIAGTIDAQAQEMIDNVNQKYTENFRAPLTRLSSFPRELIFSSDNDGLSVRIHQANARQLAAPTPPPGVPDNFDLGVAIHESIINNFASTLHAGRTLSSEEVAESKDKSPILKKFLEKQEAKRKAKQKDADKVAKKQGPWKITFAKRHPVTVEFRDGGVRIAIRATKFEGDGPAEKRAMSIVAEFKFETAQKGGLNLVLKDWDVLPTAVELGERDRIPPAAEPLRQKLKKRFTEIFQNVELDPLELPGKWEQAGELAYKSVESKEGWLVITLKQVPGTGNSKDRLADKPDDEEIK